MSLSLKEEKRAQRYITHPQDKDTCQWGRCQVPPGEKQLEVAR